MTGATGAKAEPEPDPAAGFEPHPHGHPRAMERVEKALERAAHRVVARAERPGRPAWALPLAKFAIPLLLALAGLALLPILFPESYGRLLLFLTQYFTTPGGVETSLPVGIGLLHLRAAVLVAVIVYATMVVALFMVWNLELLDRVPRLGPMLRRLEGKMEAFYRKRPWVERSAFWGIALLAALPVSGTGALPGSILGKLLGLHRGLTWLAVVLGSATRTVFWTLVAVGAFKALF